MYYLKRIITFVLAASLCMVVFTGCGKVKANDTAVTINGETVSAGTASTFIRYQQAEASAYQQYIYQMYGMEFDNSNFWSQDYGDEGQTYGEFFVESAKQDLVKMVLIRQHAEEYGYTLSEEEKTKITEAAKQFISDNGSVANWIGADQASVENMLSLYNYQTMTHDLFIADVDREVSDEEAAQSTILYAYISNSMPDDFEGSEEEYAAQAKDLMSQMLETSKTADLEQIEAEAHAEEENADTDTEEAEEDVEKTLSEIVSEEVHAYNHVAAEISEDITVTSGSFGTAEDAENSLEDEIITAAKALKDGEFCNDIIETDSGYYMIKMEAVFDEDATESKKTSIISDRETNAYNDLIQSWVDSADVVYGKAFDKITVTDKESYVISSN